MLSNGSKTLLQRSKYKLEAPEGGWGYVVALSFAAFFILCSGQLVVFGIIYGNFLVNLGDDSGAATTMYGVFFTVQALMNLVANYLLRKHSYRFIGLIGSFFWCIGNFLTIFATSIPYIIFTFGVIQGIGFGLMAAIVYTSFNQYFIVRKANVMAITQSVISAATIGIPYVVHFLLDEYGFQGALAIITAASSNIIAAMLTLQPVEWHMRKVPLSFEFQSLKPGEELKISLREANTESNEKKVTEITTFLDQNTKTVLEENTDALPKNPKKKNKVWVCIYNFLELGMLKDPSFVNIVVGISTTFISDIMLITVLPIIIFHLGYDDQFIALVMTLTVTADLIGRLILSVLTAFFTFKSRYLFLYGSAASAVIRFAFTVINGGSTWVMTACFLQGLHRSLIQVMSPLVIAEYTQERFAAANGVLWAVSAVISIILGFLSGWAASFGDEWIMHLLTVNTLVCCIPWTIELIYVKIKK